MKKLLFSLSFSLLACMALFNACSTDVELYADYKDIPVIYGLIDATQDTNYVRINRAFSGNNDNPINANEVALIADSCNYPGKLDAKIIEYKSGYGNNFVPTGRVMVLVTVTIHDKEEGVLYAPDQKVYYTAERFNVNTSNTRYKYRLEVLKNNDTISAETGVVGGEEFRIITNVVPFLANPQPINSTSKITFKPSDYAVFYDVKMVFHYKERHGDNEVEKQVRWDFGPRSIDELDYDDVQKCYFLKYLDVSLFSLLEEAIGGDTVINSNHPNVQRYFDNKPIEIMIAAGGDELYNYIQVNSVSGYSQTVPDYTNIKGGYGVFSSRINITKSVPISGRAQTDLYEKRSWGFIQQ